MWSVIPSSHSLSLWRFVASVEILYVLGIIRICPNLCIEIDMQFKFVRIQRVVLSFGPLLIFVLNTRQLDLSMHVHSIGCQWDLTHAKQGSHTSNNETLTQKYTARSHSTNLV